MSAWPRRLPPAPWWFALIIIVVALPSMAFIPQASYIVDRAEWLGSSLMGWLYPAYVVLSGVCAWMCYPARRTLAWILVALMVITDIALFVTYIYNDTY